MMLIVIVIGNVLAAQICLFSSSNSVTPIAGERGA